MVPIVNRPKRKLNTNDLAWIKHKPSATSAKSSVLTAFCSVNFLDTPNEYAYGVLGRDGFSDRRFRRFITTPYA